MEGQPKLQAFWSHRAPPPPTAPAAAAGDGEAAAAAGGAPTFSRKRRRLAAAAAAQEAADGEERAAGSAGVAPATAACAPPPAKRPSPPPAAGPAAAPRARQRTQTFLDVGQHDFHGTRCPACGLVYTPGVPDDERLHAAFHASASRGLSYAPPPPGEEKVVRAAGAGAGAGGKVVMLLAGGAGGGGSRHARRQLAELAAFLERQMGLAPGWLLARPSTVLLYVAGRRVLGCAVAEQIREAFPVLPAAPAPAPAAAAAPPAAVAADWSRRTRASCGVRLVWVALEARRRGVASALLDCARARAAGASFAVVPRREVAFSQPTAAGRALAEAYTGAPDFLVYE